MLKQSTAETSASESALPHHHSSRANLCFRWVQQYWKRLFLQCAMLYIFLLLFQGGLLLVQAKWHWNSVSLNSLLLNVWLFLAFLVVFAVLCIIRMWSSSHRSSSRGYILRHTLAGHTESLVVAVWSPKGVVLASGSVDGTLNLWHGQTGKILHTLSRHTSPPWSVMWSKDGQTLVSSYLDGSLRLWNAATGDLLHTLASHTDLVWSIVWSPDEQVLASGSLDGNVRLWSTETGALSHTILSHPEPVVALAWSPHGQLLASGALDYVVRIWHIGTGQLAATFTSHTGPIKSLSWSRDGRVLTSFALDGTLRRWDTQTGQQVGLIEDVPAYGVSVWSPDGETLAVSAPDSIIHLWDIGKGRRTHTLEGQAGPIRSLSFSSDGERLASFSCTNTRNGQGAVRIWRWNTTAWELTSVIPRVIGEPFIAFHPEQPIFAAPDKDSINIEVWSRNDLLRENTSRDDSVYYVNAKVVLVGDSGVGKSGLALVLSDRKFALTESTHGRQIQTLQEKRIYRHDQCIEIRETLLWDLAGQPGYRLIHQLHLDEVAIALVVFDARSDTDPFAGVEHWDRALRQAQSMQGISNPPIKKFLVAARVDRGGIGVSAKRIESLVHELEFHSFFETSAKEGLKIAALKLAIEESIPWEALPKVSSTRLFLAIKTFLVTEKEAGRLLETKDALYRAFLVSKEAPPGTEELRVQFETCIGRVESAGLLKRLSFGNLVLLRPELLDAYASALVIAVRDTLDGLGSIREEDVRKGNFRMPEDERFSEREQEQLLLIAMVEDLLQRELVLREEAQLVFPSQLTREPPDLLEPEGKSIVFAFDGPINNIYATLVVRLANSGMFQKKELWRNAVTYTDRVGGKCGIFLELNSEGHGELSLFFDKETSEQTSFHFEEYILLHLQRNAVPESIKRRRIFVCFLCGTELTEQMVQRRIERGFTTLSCPVCSGEISLHDREKRLVSPHTSMLQGMDRAADQRRNRETFKSILQGKIQSQDYDVYFCYNREDELAVKRYGELLKKRGVLPWLDEWEIPPGRQKIRIQEEQITQMKCAAVFVGETGIGPWADLEIGALLRQFVQRNCPVIPVLLPEAPAQSHLPPFLQGFTWIDCHKQAPEPLDMLLWGITGEQPS